MSWKQVVHAPAVLTVLATLFLSLTLMFVILRDKNEMPEAPYAAHGATGTGRAHSSSAGGPREGRMRGEIAILGLAALPSLVALVMLVVRDRRLRVESKRRRQAEFRLSESVNAQLHGEELWREILDHLPLDVWMLGTDGTCLAQNAHAEHNWGDNKGKTLAESSFPGELRARWARLPGLIWEEGLSTCETQYQREGRTRRVLELACPVRERSEKVGRIIMIHFDISERKAAEAARENLELQIRQNQKLEAIGTLAGGIAHDFNNILAIISCNAELALFENNMPEEQRQYVLGIVDASKRARDLIKQILAFSRKRKPERSLVFLSPLLLDSVLMMRASLPKTILIREKIPECLPPVFVEPVSVHQVVMNLCTNAAHAMRDRKEGLLEIELDLIEADEGLRRLKPELKPGSYLRLRVSDNGTGMDEETLGHIFEPFFTTKAPGEGTGLGLAVVYGIMKEHGGSIIVSSRPSEGSTFQLFFPAVHDQVPQKDGENAVLPRGHGQKIIIVDDERDLVRAFASQVEKLGYRVFSFSEPESALDFFNHSPQSFGAIITDFTMPKMTGAMLMTEVWKKRSDMPAVLMGGDLSSVEPFQKEHAGLIVSLGKPCSFSALAVAVSKVVNVHALQ